MMDAKDYDEFLKRWNDGDGAVSVQEMHQALEYLIPKIAALQKRVEELEGLCGDAHKRVIEDKERVYSAERRLNDSMDGQQALEAQVVAANRYCLGLTPRQLNDLIPAVKSENGTYRQGYIDAAKDVANILSPTAPEQAEPHTDKDGKPIIHFNADGIGGK